MVMIWLVLMQYFSLKKREKNTALHKCSHDASQTGVLPKPLTDCCVLPGKPDLWHVIWRVQLGPVNLLGKHWVLVSPCCLVAHQAPGSPTETLDSTQGTITAWWPPVLPIRRIKSQQHNNSGEEHLETERKSATVCQGQSSKQKSGTRTFWILQSWETTHSYVNHVWFYDSRLYWLMFFIFLHRGPVKVFVKPPTVYIS